MIVRHVKRPGKPCVHTIYGITCDEYEALRERAGDRCEICGISGPESAHYVLHIDHEGGWGHKARVRGLLCGRCNTSLHRPSVVSDEQYEAYMANAFYLSIPPRQPPGPSEDHLRRMAELHRLATQYRSATTPAERRSTRAPLWRAMFEAQNAGVRQVDIAKSSGYPREQVYLIAKKLKGQEEGVA